MINLKTPAEIERIRAAGHIVTQAHQRIRPFLKPGISTGEIDREAAIILAEYQSEAIFLGSPGVVPFPATTCISLNEQLSHGIPGDRILREGDVVTVDLGCRHQGWCAEAAWTSPVGTVSQEGLRLLSAGESLLRLVLRLCSPGKFWSQVLRELDQEWQSEEYTLIRTTAGHGIGRHLHEDPQVPILPSRCFQQRDFQLVPGLVLAIEPMITRGKAETQLAGDGWTVEMRDGELCAHYEQTIAITEQGVVNLTPLESTLEKSGGEPRD